jgi:hypothetical protein
MMLRDSEGEEEYATLPDNIFEGYIKDRSDEEIITFISDYMQYPEEFTK